MVDTRLERDVERRPSGLVAGGLESHDFCVRTARGDMPAFSHHVAIAHDDGADDRIRMRSAPPPLCQVERSFYECVHSQDPRYGVAR